MITLGRSDSAQLWRLRRTRRELMAVYVWIAIGAGGGGLARFWCSGVVARLIGETFPWGTLAVNVVGSFIIGLVASLTGPEGRFFVSSTTRLAILTGFCGGFTTFSSFSLQTLSLMNDGEFLYAGANVVLSVVACLVAVWAGTMLAGGINSLKWI
jgi:CrcB protein